MYAPPTTIDINTGNSSSTRLAIANKLFSVSLSIVTSTCYLMPLIPQPPDVLSIKQHSFRCRKTTANSLAWVFIKPGINISKIAANRNAKGVLTKNLQVVTYLLKFENSCDYKSQPDTNAMASNSSISTVPPADSLRAIHPSDTCLQLCRLNLCSLVIR